MGSIFLTRTKPSIKLDAVISLARISNQAWFDTSLAVSDIASNELGTVRIQIVLNTSAKVQLTFNETNYYDINEGNNLVVNVIYEFYIDLELTDLVNLRSPTALTVNRCRIEQVF